jgi:hypothetical protein
MTSWILVMCLFNATVSSSNWKGMWKDVVVTIFELLVLNFPGGTENNHERPPSEQPAFGLT